MITFLYSVLFFTHKQKNTVMIAVVCSQEKDPKFRLHRGEKINLKSSFIATTREMLQN